MTERCEHCNAMIALVGIRHRCIPIANVPISSRSGTKPGKAPKKKPNVPAREPKRKKAA